MLKISSDQFAKFSEQLSKTYHDKLVRHCQEKFPVLVRQLPIDNLKQAITDGIRLAEKLGFTKRGGTTLIVELSLLFGCGFVNDPLHPWAKEALDAPDVVTEQRIARKLYEASLDYVSQLLRKPARSPAELTATLQTILKQDNFNLTPKGWEHELSSILQSYFPEHASVAVPEVFGKLIRENKAQAQQLGLTSANDIAHFITLQIAYGHCWYTDPVHHGLRDTFAKGGVLALRNAALSQLKQRGA